MEKNNFVEFNVIKSQLQEQGYQVPSFSLEELLNNSGVTPEEKKQFSAIRDVFKERQFGREYLAIFDYLLLQAEAVFKDDIRKLTRKPYLSHQIRICTILNTILPSLDNSAEVVDLDTESLLYSSALAHDTVEEQVEKKFKESVKDHKGIFQTDDALQGYIRKIELNRFHSDLTDFVENISSLYNGYDKGKLSQLIHDITPVIGKLTRGRPSRKEHPNFFTYIIQAERPHRDAGILSTVADTLNFFTVKAGGDRIENVETNLPSGTYFIDKLRSLSLPDVYRLFPDLREKITTPQDKHRFIENLSFASDKISLENLLKEQAILQNLWEKDPDEYAARVKLNREENKLVRKLFTHSGLYVRDKVKRTEEIVWAFILADASLRVAYTSRAKKADRVTDYLLNSTVAASQKLFQKTMEEAMRESANHVVLNGMPIEKVNSYERLVKEYLATEDSMVYSRSHDPNLPKQFTFLARFSEIAVVLARKKRDFNKKLSNIETIYLLDRLLYHLADRSLTLNEQIFTAENPVEHLDKAFYIGGTLDSRVS